ncbi:hypothetical protein ACI65C_001123 [Semiaphis heraclei]
MSSVSWGLPPRGGSGRNNTTLTRIVVDVAVVVATAAARSLPGVKAGHVLEGLIEQTKQRGNQTERNPEDVLDKDWQTE